MIDIIKLELEDIINLVKERYGNNVTFNHRTKDEFTFSLYDAFTFQIYIEDRYKIVYSYLLLGENIRISNLFGERIVKNNDRESIIESLELIDKYCRLRLTDKYLEEYGKLQ